MAELNTLPGWKCVRQIGAGSFGKVYEIQHTEYGKVYKAALKVVRIPQDPSDLKRAYSEGMDRRSEEHTSELQSLRLISVVAVSLIGRAHV